LRRSKNHPPDVTGGWFFEKTLQLILVDNRESEDFAVLATPPPFNHCAGIFTLSLRSKNEYGQPDK
jgi:hypothetical protein